MKQIRQGDVLLVAVAKEPKGLVEQPAALSIVLEHGEATGHAHRINEPAKVKLYHDAQAAQYLRVLEETPLAHEEHSAILLRAGRIPAGTASIRSARARVISSAA